MGEKEITLIQPRHIYAPNASGGSLGHIYMPTSLLAAASILIAAGVHVSICDDNIEPSDLPTTRFVGVNLLGAPYIPSAIQLNHALESAQRDGYRLLLGGQVVNGLDQSDMSALFSHNVINGNIPSNLSRELALDSAAVLPIEHLSMIPAFERLSDAHLKTYLQSEFSFYLSQGCKHSCSFCAAVRSVNVHGIKRRVAEVYRDLDLALRDFEYLLQKAQEFGIAELDIYLSNLDLFQSPENLDQFMEGVICLRHTFPNLDVRMRGLSTSRSFLTAHRNHAKTVRKSVDAGLFRVGFGIDGATPRVYKETRKPQTVQESIDAVLISRREYSIEPEALMVFGHNEKEDEDALRLAVRFCRDMFDEAGALPRPHVAKEVVPGNDGWLDPRKRLVRQALHEDPVLFQNLDFTALPSPLTHPDAEFRALVSKYYIEVCDLPGALTQYVFPLLPGLPEGEFERRVAFNSARYDI